MPQSTKGYPRSFWFIFSGMLVSAAGGSMIWPFLTIFMRQELDVPLATIGVLLTIHSIAGLLATSVAGPAVDRFGRKAAMILGLVAGAGATLGMSQAKTLVAWGGLLVISGAFGPMVRVASNSMIADLVEPDRRHDAYALLRMGNNVGVAIGPMVGGFVTSISYAIAFYAGASAQLFFAMLVMAFVPETAPREERQTETRAGGYGPVLRDRAFLAFCGVYAIAGVAYSMMMVLLPVYGKENFGVMEKQYGFIMATNAAMVVFFQYGITRITQRFPELRVLAVGALFYALGVGSVAWGWGFSTFLISMVILTIGEMIMIPTSTALTANMAPVDMRGRYMGLYSLTWGIGFGIGPVIGGILNDNLAPAAIWYAGMAFGLVGALGFTVLAKMLPGRGPQTVNAGVPDSTGFLVEDQA